MAKYTYKTWGGKLLVEFEAKDTKTLVEELSAIQDVCEQEKCSNCDNKDINNFRFVTRLVGDDKYYELMCKGCGFKLGFGQPKKNPNLYPRRRNNKTKQPIGPKRDGWHKFESEDEKDDE
jgi:hypothetical protein